MLYDFFTDFKKRVSIFKVKLSNIFHKQPLNDVEPSTPHLTNIETENYNVRLETLYHIRGFVSSMCILLESQDYIGPTLRQHYNLQFLSYLSNLGIDNYSSNNLHLSLTTQRDITEKSLIETYEKFNLYCNMQTLHHDETTDISNSILRSDELAQINCDLHNHIKKQEFSLNSMTEELTVLRSKVQLLTCEKEALSKQADDLQKLQETFSNHRLNFENQRTIEELRLEIKNLNAAYFMCDADLSLEKTSHNLAK